MNSRFFCKNCGEKVSAADKTCPSCKTRFISVQCPGCGMKEEASFFKHGCPVCGYGKNEITTDWQESGKKKNNVFALSLMGTFIVIILAVILLTLTIL